MAALEYAVYVAPSKLAVSDDLPRVRTGECGPRPHQQGLLR